MAPTDSPDDRLWVLVRVWVDAFTYALAVAGLTGFGALVLGIATGGGLVRSKVLLFAIGWVLTVYAVVRLWPTSPMTWAPHRRVGTGNHCRSFTIRRGFRRSSGRFPVRWIRAPPPENG